SLIFPLSLHDALPISEIECVLECAVAIAEKDAHIAAPVVDHDQVLLAIAVEVARGYSDGCGLHRIISRTGKLQLSSRRRNHQERSEEHTSELQSQSNL